jgi:N-acetyl-anhydromuramyl-L-alanine amidase AmpD
VSLCGMTGSQEKPFRPGPYPLTRAQWDKTVAVVAELCERYKIPVTPKTVLSHAEVQTNLGIRQRNKWDIAVLPFDRSVVVVDVDHQAAPRLRKSGIAKSSASSRPTPNLEG